MSRLVNQQNGSPETNKRLYIGRRTAHPQFASHAMLYIRCYRKAPYIHYDIRLRTTHPSSFPCCRNRMLATIPYCRRQARCLTTLSPSPRSVVSANLNGLCNASSCSCYCYCSCFRLEFAPWAKPCSGSLAASFISGLDTRQHNPWESWQFLFLSCLSMRNHPSN